MVALAELSAHVYKANRWGYGWIHLEIPPLGQDARGEQSFRRRKEAVIEFPGGFLEGMLNGVRTVLRRVDGPIGCGG